MDLISKGQNGPQKLGWRVACPAGSGIDTEGENEYAVSVGSNKPEARRTRAGMRGTMGSKNWEKSSGKKILDGLECPRAMGSNFSFL